MRRHSGNYHWAKTRRRSLLTYGRAAPEEVLRGGGVPADWYVDFVNDYAYNGLPVTVSSLFSVQRTSAASYVNRAGVISYVSSNQIRYGDKGVLVEEYRENLALKSQEFEHAAWNISESVTRTANQVTAPDGTVTGDQITANAADLNHFVGQTVTSGDGTYSASIFVKPSNHQFISLQLDDQTSHGVGILVDLNAGYIIADLEIGTEFNIVSRELEEFTDGWLRVCFTATTNASAVKGFSCRLRKDAADTTWQTSWLAAGTETVYVWGAQLEIGPRHTSYIPSTGSIGIRQYEVVSILNTPRYTGDVQGTLYAEAIAKSGVSGQTNHLIIDNLNNTPQMYGAPTWSVDNSGIGTVRADSSVTADGHAKVASTYDIPLSQFVISANGSVSVTATNGAVTLVRPVDYHIGTVNGFVSSLNGYIQRLALWTVKLAPDALQDLTTPGTSWTLTSNNYQSLDLDFANDRAWDGYNEVSIESMLSHSRTSPGYYLETDGTLTKFGDVARTNSVPRSGDLSHSDWTLTEASITGNAALAPDGTMSAAYLIANTAAARHYTRIVMGTDSPVIYSIYAKSDGSDAQLWLGDNAVGARAFYTLSGSGSTSAATVHHQPIIEALDDDWYRCILLIHDAGEVTYDNNLWVGTSFGSDQFAAGDGVSGIYLWGMQAEALTAWNQYASEYIPTTTVPVTVAAVTNVLRTGGNGVMYEQARTNIVKNSQIFTPYDTNLWFGDNRTVTPNTHISPTGEMNASTVAFDVDGRLYQVQVVGGGTRTWTRSFWLKGTPGDKIGFEFTTFGTPDTSERETITLTGDWVRYTFTKSMPEPNDTLLRFVISNAQAQFPSLSGAPITLQIFGYQVEEGASATSYIPTLDVPVTRDVDNIFFSSLEWYTPQNGTIYGEFKTSTGGSDGRYVASNTGATPISMTFSNDHINCFGAGTALVPALGSGLVTDFFKAATAADTSGAAQCANAGTVATNSDAEGFQMRILRLAVDGSTRESVLCKRLCFFKTKLANGVLQTLTTP